MNNFNKNGKHKIIYNKLKKFSSYVFEKNFAYIYLKCPRFKLLIDII